MSSTVTLPPTVRAPEPCGGGWAPGQLWLFIVAPLVGGAIAPGAYQALHLPVPTVLTLPEAEQALPGAWPAR